MRGSKHSTIDCRRRRVALRRNESSPTTCRAISQRREGNNIVSTFLPEKPGIQKSRQNTIITQNHFHPESHSIKPNSSSIQRLVLSKDRLIGLREIYGQTSKRLRRI
jgi:hypothetical protein